MSKVFSKINPKLLSRHYEQLSLGSGIADEVITERGYKSALGKKELEENGFGKSQRIIPGLLLPIHTPDGKTPFFNYRPDTPRVNARGKPVKYEIPADRGIRIDVPPRCIDDLKNPRKRLWITEGQKKADSLASRGEIVIDFLGVWNFKGKNEYGGTTLLADLDYIAWNDREVYIVFDSDVMVKEQVRKALDRITEHLKRKGAKIQHVYLSSNDNEKVGVDDYLLDHDIESLLSLAKKPEDVKNEAHEKTIQQTQAERLVLLIEKQNVTLFHDEFGDPFVRTKVKNHHEICKIRSKQFKRWISKQFWEKEKKVPNNDALNSALNIIEAKACFDGNEYSLHNRVVWHDNSIWYDLGNWHAVRINGDGWEIVKDPPILFRSYSHQKEQVPPEQADLNEIYDELFRYVNISNEDERLLFVANLICGLIPDIPHPIDVFHGDQGTAKTTSSRVKKEIIDPSVLKTLTSPNAKAEFAQLVSRKG